MAPMTTTSIPEPRIGSLFSGYGGLDRGVQSVIGGAVSWRCDVDPGSSKLLAHHWPETPNLGDVTAVDWASVESIDVLTGGFPCQDVSSAGRRAGMTPDSRSGLWTHMARAINVLRPRLVVIENVRGLLSADAHCDVEPCPWCLGDHEGRPLRALGAVLGDLAVLGYDAEWIGLRASDAGAPHARFRVFIAARPTSWNSPLLGWDAQPTSRTGPDPQSARTTGRPGRSAADPSRLGRREGRPEPEGELRGSDAPLGRALAIADPDSDGLASRPQHDGEQGQARSSEAACGEHVDRRVGAADSATWGDYAPAVRRWELTLGRPAPAPTMTGKRGGQQLSPTFVEFLMGLPAGHVTDVPGLSRNDQLKLLGNGVVPQQAELALRHLLAPTAMHDRAGFEVAS